MKKFFTLENLNFENIFSHLPETFYTKMEAEKFCYNPYLIHANSHTAELLDLAPSFFKQEHFLSYFTGQKNIPGSKALAMVYAGHQFGAYVPQLGDGRALLLGQVRNKNNQLVDIQLKGSGKTPYSRFGDGRAVMRSSIREYLGSEALYGLNIPTTRALCIIGTNEQVKREILEPGAIITRLSEKSFIRFGQFEYFYYKQDYSAIEVLAEHIIKEYYPHLNPDNYTEWFREIVTSTAKLIAKWQAYGFQHGVMNTDNMSITGLTIDYGPFGFMEQYEPSWVANHSDYEGRYAFEQQPTIALWNLYALAHSLQKLIELKELQKILEEYLPTLANHYHKLMLHKIGLFDPSLLPQDNKLWLDLLDIMKIAKADYTLTFRYLSQVNESNYETKWLELFNNHQRAKEWLSLYHQRLAQSGLSKSERIQKMNQINPKYILRNWVAETAIRAAEDNNDYSVIDNLIRIMHKPYSAHQEFEYFAKPAPEHLKNLCISCSS